MAPVAVFSALVIGTFLFLLGFAIGRMVVPSPNRAEERAAKKEQEEQVAALAAHADFVESLRELTWDHRETDPALAAIVLDEIRSFEKNQRQAVTRALPGGGGGGR